MKTANRAAKTSGRIKKRRVGCHYGRRTWARERSCDDSVAVCSEPDRATGDLKNTTAYNLVGWGTFALVTSAVAMMLGTRLLKLLGVKLF